MTQASRSIDLRAALRGRGRPRRGRLWSFGSGVLAGLAVAAVVITLGHPPPIPVSATALPGPAPLAAPLAASAGTAGMQAESWSLTAAIEGRLPGARAGGPAPAARSPASDPAVQVVVRRDDTLDAIFKRLSLSITDLASVRSLPGVRHALDMLKPGDVIRLTSLNGALTALERRISDTETLSVARASGGGFAARVVENPLELRTTALHGRISSSLYKTVNDLGASDLVAFELAEVFRYDIDFAQELQPGDTFTLLLEQLWRDGNWLRDGEILAAEFVNNGRSYRALRYQLPDGRREYYTPEGRSLRKAFLRAPLQFSRISSGFGMRWHPVLNRLRSHRGIDYAAPTGTPVLAAGDGRVRYRGQQGGFGNVVILTHGNSIETVYGHLSQFARSLRVGERVKQGETVGYVGMTGLATGPHLHYEYRVAGVHRNPASIKTLPAEPIAAQLRGDFEHRAQALIASLDAAAHPAQLLAAPGAARAP